jgi:exodeoxyribonuclease VIII
MGKIELNKESLTYHSDAETISVHGLHDIAKAPALYKHRKSQPQKQTDAMWWGTVIHTAVLEPTKFLKTYSCAPEDLKRTAKKAWAEVEEDAAKSGMELITYEEYKKACDTAGAVRKHPSASAVISDAKYIEPSMYWIDEQTGVKLRARPDLITNSKICVDLKTTSDARSLSFAKDIASYRYYVQAAFYLWGCKQCGVDCDTFLFIAAEKDAPFLTAVYSADEAMIALGEKHFREDLAKYAECLKTNVWSGYPEEIQNISLPTWVK